MDLDLNKIVILKNAYYRRLINLNQEIRTSRKNKVSIKELNEKRKVTNRRYNLLVELEKSNLADDQTKKLYNELLREYKNEC